ncbi:glycosyltransferase 87 family protein [Streptomyces sp. DSM 40750]|uniref:glycosyltransferase 87 family protein n=1 Tax=Streptomyces sp. DSM 40750 TaxID=2801030 RepID=UPI00214AB32B|nr:glycosyltransferase 87 family protein [Streptomyces sp. DSM 40750]UUU23063.1 glycosyltransferase 87 family protein [Streptomyces sp. DSM 40750]
MTRRSVTDRSLLASGTLFLASLSAFVALCVAQGAPMADALVYRAEGAAVRNGTDLYGFTVTEWRLPATYPPFAALLFVPTTWLPLPALKAAFVLGNTALLALLVHLSARMAGAGPLPTPAMLTATALALWLEPVFQTVLFGQINLALACLVLWDLTRPPGAPGKGVALGIATGVKLTPAVFIAYLFLTRRPREALTALTAFLATVTVGALALPSATIDFWTRRLYETERVGKTWIVDNQSLRGLLARAMGDPSPGLAWAVAASGVAAAGLWLACRAGRDRSRGDRWGVLLAAFTALLVSPISWSHHWVWCVPLLAVLWTEGHRRCAALVAAVFTARTLWLVPHEGTRDLRLPWWQGPLASPYPLFACVLLAFAACGYRARITRMPVSAASMSGGATAPGSRTK